MYIPVLTTGLLLFIAHGHAVGAECNLPKNIQRSNWNDTRTDSMLYFGIRILTNWNLKVMGSPTTAFTCITNSSNVYVFRGDRSYYDVSTNTNKRVYLCLRMTEVTENLFYFYILADMIATNIINPSQRLYMPPNEPDSDDPVCNYCQFNDPPKDSEYHLLRKENTVEEVNANPKLCLPCNATCQSNDGTTEPTIDETTEATIDETTEATIDGTTDTTMSHQMSIIITIAVVVCLSILLVITFVLFYMKRRKTHYDPAARKETEIEFH